MKNKLLIAIFVVSIVSNFVLAYFVIVHDNINYKTKYVSLKNSYIALASVQKNIFEVLLLQEDLKDFFPEYRTISKKEFEEAIRRKIVKLDIEIEELNKN